jgi:hypothetical protein
MNLIDDAGLLSPDQPAATPPYDPELARNVAAIRASPPPPTPGAFNLVDDIGLVAAVGGPPTATPGASGIQLIDDAAILGAPEPLPQTPIPVVDASSFVSVQPGRFNEDEFQQWYAHWVDELHKRHPEQERLNADPDDPRHHYDWRAAFRSGATPNPEGHWTSAFKTPEHSRRVLNGRDTITGERVSGVAADYNGPLLGGAPTAPKVQPTPLTYIEPPAGEPWQEPADYVSVSELDVQDDANLLGGVGGFVVSLGLPITAGILTGGAAPGTWLAAKGVQATAQGVAGLSGELARQYLAGEPIDWRQGLVAGATTAVPMGKGLGEALGKAGTWAGTGLTAAQRAIQGAGMGATEERLRQAARGEEGDWRKAGMAAAVGAATGGVLGGTLESRLATIGARKIEGAEKAKILAAERQAQQAAEGQEIKVPEEGLAPPVEPETKIPAGEAAGRYPHPEDLFEMPVVDMNVDPGRFQYKRAAVLPGGVTRELQGEEVFDRGAAGVVSVWMDPADGNFWVIDGHHRYAKAVASGVSSLPVRVYGPDTGVPNEGTARLMGSLLNIKAGRGDAVDAAKVFKESGLAEKDLAKFGVSLEGPVAKEGLGLAALNDALFRKVAVGDIDIPRGAMIGREMPDPAQQDVLVRMIVAHEEKYDTLSDKDLAELIRLVKNAPIEAQIYKDQLGLPGTTGGGGESLAPIMAQVSNWIAKTLAKDKASLAYVSKLARQEILARGGNVIDVELSKKIAQGTAKMNELYLKRSVQVGPVNDLLKDAARRIAKGENPQLVRAQALDAVRKELEAEFPYLSTANIGAAAPEAPAQAEVFETKPSTSPRTMSEELPVGAEPMSRPAEGQEALFPPPPPGPRHARQPIPPAGAQQAPPGPATAGGRPIVDQRRSDIVNYLAETLDVPIRVGKMGALPKNVRGIFKPQGKVVRSRLANDIGTISHEVGHHIATLQPGYFSDQALKAYEAELGPIATKAQRAGEEMGEGFAQFVRFYITNPMHAATVAPTFARHFDGVVDKDVKAMLLNARQQYRRWDEQGNVQKILSQISMDPRPQVRNRWREFRTNWIDNLQPIKEAVRAMEKAMGQKIGASKDTYKLARLFRGWQGKADHYLEVGGFDAQTLKRDGTKGLEQILFPVKEHLDEFRVFLSAARGAEYTARGLEHGFGLSGTDLAKTVRELAAAHPEFLVAQKQLDAYQDSLLQYMISRGVLSSESYAKMRAMNKAYVPFYRVIETESSKLKPGQGSTWTELFEPVKRVKKGGGQEIVDPLESIVRNTYAFISMAEANNVKRSFVQLAEKAGMMIAADAPGTDLGFAAGKYAERVPWAVKPVKVQGEDLLNWMQKRVPPEKMEGWLEEMRENLGLDPEEFKGTVANQIEALRAEISKQLGVHVPDELLLAFRPSRFIPRDAPMIPVMRNGKPYLYEVSPEIYETFANLEPRAQEDFIKYLSIPSRILRAGATLTPEFAARNPIRDQFQIWVQRRFGVTPVDFARGAWQVFKASDTAKELRRKYPGTKKVIGDEFADEIYRLYQRSGAQHAALVSMDRDYLQKEARALVQSQYDELVKSAKQPWHIPQDAVAILRAISELSEEGSRVGFFAKGLTKLGDDPDALIEAGFSTRESSVDFAGKGAKLYQQISAINAFWGARIQGADRVAREFATNPVAASARAFTAYTLPAMYLYAVNYNDGRVQELPQWQRDLFFIVPTAHVHKDAWAKMTKEEKQEFNDRWPIIRIPAGFETALAFKALPERLMDWYLKEDPEGVKRWADQMSGQLNPIQWPDVLRPIVESIPERGWSFFRQAPLIGRAQEGVEPYLQTTPYTSEIARITGEALNVGGVEGGVSPAKIDNFIQAWGGGLGILTVDALDKVLTLAGVADSPEPAARVWSDVPLVRAFVARFPTVQSQSLEDFYDLFDRVQRKTNSFRLLQQDQNAPEKAETYLRQHQDLIALEYSMVLTAKAINEYRKMSVNAAKSPELTPLQKQRLRDQYVMEMIGLAEEYVAAYRGAEKAKTQETAAGIPEAFEPEGQAGAQVKDLFEGRAPPVSSKRPQLPGYTAPFRMLMNQVLPAAGSESTSKPPP